MHSLMIRTDRAPSADANPADDLDAWIAQAARGDRQAFERLLRHYERKVLATAQQLLGQPEDAQDAAQEVFLRLYRALRRLDPQRGLGGWIYRVTVNVCRDLAQHRQKRPTSSLSEAPMDRLPATDLGSDPWRQAAWSAEKSLLAAALATLQDKERQALVLRDLQGLRCRQVAEILEISEVTVRSHICRARIKIKNFRDQRLRTNS